MAAPTACQERTAPHSPKATSRVGFIQHHTQKTTLREAGEVRGDPSSEYLGAPQPWRRASGGGGSGDLRQPPQLRIHCRVERGRPVGGRCRNDALVRAVDGGHAPAGRPVTVRKAGGEG